MINIKKLILFESLCYGHLSAYKYTNILLNIYALVL